MTMTNRIDTNDDVKTREMVETTLGDTIFEDIDDLSSSETDKKPERVSTPIEIEVSQTSIAAEGDIVEMRTKPEEPEEDQNQSSGHQNEEIRGELVRLNKGVEGLAREFQGKIKYDAHKDKIIDRLHAELQEYRNDLVKKLLRPVFMDIILAADDIRKLVRSYRSKETAELDPHKLLSLMDSFPDDLEDILYRQGVDSYENDSSFFDPKKQKVVKKVPTQDPEKDRTIAERMRKGYEWEDKIFRPEMVSVHVYKAADVANGESPSLETHDAKQNENAEGPKNGGCDER